MGPAACPAALLLMVAGCGDSASDPERPTIGEAKAVGEAASMLDERTGEGAPAAVSPTTADTAQ